MVNRAFHFHYTISLLKVNTIFEYDKCSTIESYTLKMTIIKFYVYDVYLGGKSGPSI